MDDLSMAVHKAIQYCIDHDHLRDFLILNQAEVAAMSLLEGSWEEYADSMDQELERLKKSEKALKKEVLEKDAELERVSREKDAELEKVSREKDEKLQAQAKKIKELEALLASKQ
jgi:predicted RNase H-like nuclease (RuvC/YqgF family)